MSEDIFETIAKLEKHADEIVEKARQQAKELRREVEHKLKTLAEELERDYHKQRDEIEREIAIQRERLLRDFEQRIRASLEKLDVVRREKVAPLVEHVIKAFLEQTHGH